MVFLRVPSRSSPFNMVPENDTTQLSIILNMNGDYSEVCILQMLFLILLLSLFSPWLTHSRVSFFIEEGRYDGAHNVVGIIVVCQDDRTCLLVVGIIRDINLGVRIILEWGKSEQEMKLKLIASNCLTPNYWTKNRNKRSISIFQEISYLLKIRYRSFITE